MNILIVNPDESFLSFLSSLLEEDGHHVSIASDVTSALQVLEQGLPDLVVVEKGCLEQPFLTGLSQHDELPIILPITGSTYKLKHIEAIAACVDRRDETLRVGGLVIDQSSTQAYFNGHRIQLTPTQFRLLRHLALNVGRVVEYRELLQELGGRSGEDKEAQELLKVYIYQIRHKLGWAPNEYLQSARGFGYVLIAPL